MNSTDLKLGFDTVDGRWYSIYRSIDLEDWSPLTTERGTGQIITRMRAGEVDVTKEFFTVTPDNSLMIDPATTAE